MPETKKRPRATPRAILTFDLDCFYASVAIRSRPHLKDKPVVVVQKHLCVTSNYVARQRAHGAVQKMTPVSKALRACPDLVQIDGSDLTPFRAANAEVMAIVRDFLQSRVTTLCKKLAQPPFQSPCQRQGLDEVFIDVTQLVAAEISAGGRPYRFEGHVFGATDDDDMHRTLMVASQIASELRREISTKTQLTLCAGVSDRKLLAKLAVDMHKPNNQTTFLPGNAKEYITAMPPRKLPGFGYAMDTKVQAWVKEAPGRPEISTAGDLVHRFSDGRKGLQELAAIVGTEAVARTVLGLCQGEDDSEVLESGDAPKSMASMDSFRSCTSMEDLRRRARERSTDLVTRLLRDGQRFHRRPRTLTVGYRFRGGGYHGAMRATSMPAVVSSLSSSKGGDSVDVCIGAIQKAILLVLREHGNISASSTFDLTLLTVGATNFTNQLASNFTNKTLSGNENNASLQGIANFFRKSDASVTHMPQTKPTEPSLSIDSPASSPQATGSCPICDHKLPPNIVLATRHVDRCLRGKDVTVKAAKTACNTRRVDSFFSKR